MFSIPKRIASASWVPLLFILGFLLISAGLMLAAEKTSYDKEAYMDEEYTYGLGYYYVWSVFFNDPYGEISPMTAGGKTMTAFIGLLSILYIPYVVTLVAYKNLSSKQEQLSEYLLQNNGTE